MQERNPGRQPSPPAPPQPPPARAPSLRGGAWTGVSHAWTHTPCGLLCLVASLSDMGSGSVPGAARGGLAPARGRGTLPRVGGTLGVHHLPTGGRWVPPLFGRVLQRRARVGCMPGSRVAGSPGDSRLSPQSPGQTIRPTPAAPQPRWSGLGPAGWGLARAGRLRQLTQPLCIWEKEMKVFPS